MVAVLEVELGERVEHLDGAGGRAGAVAVGDRGVVEHDGAADEACSSLLLLTVVLSISSVAVPAVVLSPMPRCVPVLAMVLVPPTSSMVSVPAVTSNSLLVVMAAPWMALAPVEFDGAGVGDEAAGDGGGLQVEG